MTHAKKSVLPMRTCAPAGDAPSWAGCLSLLALVLSLRLVAAEDEKLQG